MGRNIFVVIYLAMLTWDSISCGDKEIECNATSPKTVTFYDSVLNCPEKTICNHVLKVIGREPKPRLCVEPKEICDYSCNPTNTSIVSINFLTFVCGEGQICNVNKTSCAVCLDKDCDKGAFTCGDDPSKVLINSIGMTVSCPSEEVCNKDYKAPCKPCIPKETTGTTSTTETTTVTTPSGNGVAGFRRFRVDPKAAAAASRSYFA